ncbi:glycosidase [Deinococcus sp. LM3]|uniref:glycoside hydrolase family 130 protein n=1 Tax=Deinococcus sp. LM3 TaxID=1938608 RepID=UPI00099480B6|nr:glycosidase [Deinococcus sp. LM3]OOV12808.1 glycosidase [Deinococcus sp. LM3]
MTRLPTRRSTLFTRSDLNPLLSAADWPYPANSVFNAGATLLRDGTTLLLCRVEDFRGLSHLTAARSADGLTDWQIDPAPTLQPSPDHPDEVWGIEDPRITYLPEEDQYAVLYTAYSPAGPGVALALTRDFVTFERRGLIFPPEDKDAAIFPTRFGENWAALHRPVTSSSANIHLSFSENLRHFGDSRSVLEARRGPWWDARKVGLSAPPIRTDEGWLVIYHGVKVTGGGVLYRNGLALLDLHNPSVCLRRSDPWILGPHDLSERVGDVANVVFPCGTVLQPDGDTLRVYYGQADTSIGLATASLSELLRWLRDSSSVPGSTDTGLD